MKVALFVTCLVDLMRPSIGFAAIRLLESAGCEVVVPESQTCCGQPAFNSGDRKAAIALARKAITEFEGFDYVVAPSGSCADQIRTEYPGLFIDDPEWRRRAEALAASTWELTSFLVDVLKVQTVPGRFDGSHRGLGIGPAGCAVVVDRHGLGALLGEVACDQAAEVLGAAGDQDDFAFDGMAGHGNPSFASR